MKLNKEIVITPHQIVIGLLLFLGLALTFFSLAPKIAQLPLFVGPAPVGMSAETAARTGVESFFSVDAKLGQAAWEKQVCAVATESGCQMTKKVFAPMMWAPIAEKGLRLSCKVISAKLAYELSPENQAWDVTSICSNLDTGETSQGSTRIFIAGSNATGWKLERISFDQEPQ